LRGKAVEGNYDLGDAAEVARATEAVANQARRKT
jgi:hypothetical protein